LVRARTRSESSSSGRIELTEEARFTLEEAFRVERLPESEKLVVEVVAQLVEERAEKRLELDDLYSLGGAHPNRDDARSTLTGFIEAVKLTRRPGGSSFQDLDR